MKSRKRSRGLHACAVLMAVIGFLLLVSGALVAGNVDGAQEAHRIVAAVVAALVIAVSTGIGIKDDRRWMKWLAGLAVLAVVVDGVSGGLDVHYPKFPLASGHSDLAQVFFVIIVSLALFTSPRWNWGEPKASDFSRPPLGKLAVVVSAVVLAETVLGSVHPRHEAGMLAHAIVGGVVFGLAFYLLARVLKVRPLDPRLLGSVAVFVTFATVEIFMGIGLYVMEAAAAGSSKPVITVEAVEAGHLALGALVLATSVVAAYHIYRFTVPSGDTASAPSPDSVTISSWP